MIKNNKSFLVSSLATLALSTILATQGNTSELGKEKDLEKDLYDGVEIGKRFHYYRRPGKHTLPHGVSAEIFRRGDGRWREQTKYRNIHGPLPDDGTDSDDGGRPAASAATGSAPTPTNITPATSPASSAASSPVSADEVQTAASAVTTVSSTAATTGASAADTHNGKFSTTIPGVTASTR
jgi:hypothetical protein